MNTQHENTFMKAAQMSANVAKPGLRVKTHVGGSRRAIWDGNGLKRDWEKTNSFDSPRIATTVASCKSFQHVKGNIGLPRTHKHQRNKEIQWHTHRTAPRTPDERQPDTSNIVILVANGRTEVAKLMPQSKEAFEGNLPTSTLEGFLISYTSSSTG